MVEFLAYKKFGIVRMPKLKMLENVLKLKEMATVHARKHFSWDWDEIGMKMAKKGHLLPKSGIN